VGHLSSIGNTHGADGCDIKQLRFDVNGTSAKQHSSAMAHKSEAPERPSSSISNERGRELADKANDLGDDEAMRRHAAAMADLLIDIFLTHRATQR
jgi:hypothetical protein